MQPAPSLAEVPPKAVEPRHGPGMSINNLPPGPEPPHPGQPAPTEPGSPPGRKDTTSSASTIATTDTRVSTASTETTSSAYSLDSPTYSAQAVFSVKDGADVAANRRASRRRTGPLSAVQRERAALIRKLGACVDCRRRRVACHPNHHNMTWEDAARKYRSHSPTLQELATVSGRPLSPAPLSARTTFGGSDDMDLDTPTAQQPGRPSLSDARTRTPLPSAPRPDKLGHSGPLPSIANLTTGLESSAARILSSPHRSRYSSVQALLVHWQDEEDQGVRSAIMDLASVLDSTYGYNVDIKPIPSNSDGYKSSRWLSREINEFIDNRDQRDVLKIVYYNGYSYLDVDREMVLASSKAMTASAVRWSGIQQVLEDACSDTLIIMDAAYYASSKLLRRQGVLELIAASASENHVNLLDRSAFTRALTQILHFRANQKLTAPMSAAELHVKLLSYYPKMMQDRHQEKEVLTSFPSPMHIQLSGNAQLPSISLVQLRKDTLPPITLDNLPGGSTMSLNFRLSEETINVDAWSEWLRLMPEGIRAITVEGPYPNTLR